MLPSRNPSANHVDAEHAQFVDVLAPASLPAGFVFLAQLEDSIIEVTVPRGGVVENEVFQVLVPEQRTRQRSAPSSSSSTRQSSGSKDTVLNDPCTRLIDNEQDVQSSLPTTTQWKDGLFDCFRFGLLHPSLLNAWCCPQILLAQLLDRMGMSWLAGDNSKRKTTSSAFHRMVYVFTLLCVYDFFFLHPPSIEVQTNEETGELEAFSLSSAAIREVILGCLTIPFSIWTFITVVRLRAGVRATYGIETGRCGRAEDTCRVFCCHCCTLAQLARQTHPENDIAASCCSKNGLPLSGGSDKALLDVCHVV